MKKYLKSLLKNHEVLQRGDSGTIYIVFIMAVIIMASYVMVNGLKPEFDDNLARQQAAGSDVQLGPGGLPDLPPKGSEEYKEQKECAKKAKGSLSNERIKKKGSITIEC